jgi:rubredoxin
MDDRHTCPVCGYPDLEQPPWANDAPSDEICPSCGTHFGYDDFAGGDAGRREQVYRALRADWKAGGARWFSVGSAAPSDWDPAVQVAVLEDS